MSKVSQPDNQRLNTVISSLKKRGNDGLNHLKYENNVFLHSRLDLNGDSSASQPIRVKQKIILYNGEIYNKKEITKRFDLQKDLSDTHILTQLLSFLPLNEVADQLNGMYAIGVYDIDTNILELSVDTFGQKPLFYHTSAKETVFGSQAIILSSTPSINSTQLLTYLNFGFVTPENSFFNGVMRVQPGQTVKIDTLTGRIMSTFSKNVKKIRGSAEIISPGFLTEYLDSFYDTGVMLSGGIDSSLIASLYNNSYKKLKKAFTVDVHIGQFSEVKQARKYADILNIDLDIIQVDESNISDLWLQAIELLDEPNSDSALITTQAIMKHASGKVKCILSGDGGDEIFGGYNRHKIAYLLSLTGNKTQVRNLLLKISKSRTLVRSVTKVLFPSTTGGEYETRLLSLSKVLSEEAQWFQYMRMFAFDDIFIEDYRKRYLNDNAIEEFDAEKFLFFDRYHYLVGNNLTRMDKISLGNKIEVRSPLLDDRLQPIKLSSLRFASKPYLKQLHSATFGKHKLKKRGFSIPLSSLADDELLKQYYNIGVDVVSDLLIRKSIPKYSEVNPRRKFNIASLGLWCSKNL